MESARNLYKNDVDFAALALQSRDFAKHLRFNGQLDFQDEAAVRQLTISLLWHDFGLKVELPNDRLCPPVPNRLNYILWVQDLLDSTAGTIHETYDPDREVLGLDIGTGCCSIYPLLGCKTRPRWKFIATDIDEQNARTAQQNVALNALEPRIRIVKTDPKDALFPVKIFNQKNLDFTMCNPPFYASQAEMLSSAETKSHVPFSACTGAAVEMVSPGGEVEFVTRMIDESLHLRDQIQWYTSMLGKLSSVTTLVELLVKHNNHNYAVTEFVQGSRTKRWAVAWSWGDRRPSMSVARSIPGFPKHLLPFPADFSFALSPETSIDTAISTLNAELSSLPWYWAWDKSVSAGVGFATENVWSRQARRKMKITEQAGSGKLDAMPEDVALGVRIQLKLQRAKHSEENEVQVVIRWIQGTDSVLFESFCGMAKRKMEGK
ncbi:RNA N6-adenosine-methyltransferase METTL16 [Penicillium canariense]|uniref:RNA N6-adenosine-methyltransferase METTL16 n=1 Tax=Penicillium canariense TaxID=189055 RepID=A0A9W9IHK9_9EURO|nr:RNA N6-adenosine-methyltransferase METTL16 [Penicillium canariense]KAJ5176572.1 RNA N6-adenosine-methyltransferase METTL16 [Penicillium canariense]